MVRWTKFCKIFEEKLGEKLSKFSGIVYDHPYLFLLIVIIGILVSIGGFYFQETENDITKMYVPQDAPILVNERYFNKKWDFLPKFEVMWLTSNPRGNNVITKESIDMMFEIDKKVKELEITYNNKQYGYYDLCYVNYITKKCETNGILNFWNSDPSLFEEDKILEVINGQKNIVTSQCLDKLTGIMGIQKNDQNQVISAKMLYLNYAMDQKDENIKYLEKWESKFIDEFLKLKNQLEKDNSKQNIIFQSSSSINIEVGKATASSPITYVIGYILMGLLLWLTIATSIVITTLTDLVVLLIGLSSPFDAVVYFCGYGSCCIFFVIFFQFTLFIIMLSFEAKRIHNQRNAFLICMRTKSTNLLKKKKIINKKKSIDVEMSDSDPNSNSTSDYETGSENTTSGSDTGSNKKINSDTNIRDSMNSNSDIIEKKRTNPDPDSDSNSTLDSVTDSITDSKEKNTKKKKDFNKLKLDFFQRFLKEKYVPFILNKKVSIFIIIIFLGYFGVSIYFATQVEEGFDKTSVLPDDSYLQEMFEVMDIYCNPTGEGFYIVIKEDTKYHEKDTKNDLLKLIDDFRHNEKWVSRGPYSWYEDYLNYLQTEDDAPTLDSDGLPVNPDEFYSYLQDSFLQNPDYIHYKLASDIIFNENENDINKQIEVSRLIFYSTDLSQTNDQVDFMFDVRDITTDSEINCFVYNAFYYLSEQYSIVKQSTLMSVGFAILAVLLLAFIFFIYPTNAILIILTIIMIDVDLYGFLWLMGLTIEPVSSICLIMSVGFAVDYSAHIIHCYTTSKGKTRKEKVIQSITKIGSSVLLGGLTTFFGLTPIILFATSEIFRTLVKILYATIVSGLLHGFVFLPVVLRFLGAKGSISDIKQKEDENNQTK
ncbi:patched domain-containing protein [Anaeramoeba flamelloides]|uniref:Patched domain-containing protein n=1 Tax=Anaeramoeba flamelloides TaxID=1746091 RepID=A0ABQ8YBI8_9EUKA|nr:patched domain-containing protein [Anaeramoeba flamelloides]